MNYWGVVDVTDKDVSISPFPWFSLGCFYCWKENKKNNIFFFSPKCVEASMGAWLIWHSNVSVGRAVARNEFPLSVFQGPSIRAFTLLQNGCLLRGFRGEGIMNVIWWNKEPGRLVAVVVPRWSWEGKWLPGTANHFGYLFSTKVRRSGPSGNWNCVWKGWSDKTCGHGSTQGEPHTKSRMYN